MAEKHQGMLVLVSGPSGVGKGTLCDRLIREDTNMCFSVSATTREPRAGEINHRHYHFISEEEFDQKRENNEFLEWATVHDHRYGTLLKPVIAEIEAGRDVLMDIDSQGALKVMRNYKNCVSIFILPPNYQILRQRLKTRNTDSEAEIRKRIKNAKREIAKLPKYHYALVNNDLEQAYEILKCIITAERQRTLRFLPAINEES